MANKILIEVDPEIEELIPNYLSSLQKTSENLTMALKVKDFDTCRRLGHNLKGSGGSYGFHFVSECGKFIELAAKDRQATVLERNIQELLEYLNHIEVKVA